MNGSCLDLLLPKLDGGVKLEDYLLIPITLEAHDLLQALAFNHFQCTGKSLFLLPDEMSVNGLLWCHTNALIDVFLNEYLTKNYHILRTCDRKLPLYVFVRKTTTICLIFD